MKRYTNLGLILILTLVLVLSGCGGGTSKSGTPPAAPGAPAAPGTPIVTPIVTPAYSQLTVNWTSVTGAASYEVWYSQSNDSGDADIFTGDSNNNDTTCIISGLTNATIYYVWVKAKNSAGTSGFSPGSSGTPVAPLSSPAAPGLPTITDGLTKLSVTWSAVTGATHYEVYYSLSDNNNGLGKYEGDNDETDTTCTITGLSEGNTYYVWVKAKNSVGTSDFSPVASGKTISFMLSAVAGTTFHTGIDDQGGDYTINYTYMVAQTEVTYQLWSAVYNWATDAARGTNRYHFQNAGQIGSGGITDNQHPVTCVNWRDAMVWCNALTEYFNEQYAVLWTCVYTYNSAVVRDSRNTNAGACDNVVAVSNSNGFRLPTSMEWEQAARYTLHGPVIPGNHVSGDKTGYCYPNGSGTSTVFGNYAWYSANSSGSTHPVKSKLANENDLYDMSGNVYEWCFDLYPGSGVRRILRGGGYVSDPYFLRLGLLNDNLLPGSTANYVSFRPVRTPQY